MFSPTYFLFPTFLFNTSHSNNKTKLPHYLMVDLLSFIDNNLHFWSYKYFFLNLDFQKIRFSSQLLKNIILDHLKINKLPISKQPILIRNNATSDIFQFVCVLYEYKSE